MLHITTCSTCGDPQDHIEGSMECLSERDSKLAEYKHNMDMEAIYKEEFKLQMPETEILDRIEEDDLPF